MSREEPPGDAMTVQLTPQELQTLIVWGHAARETLDTPFVDSERRLLETLVALRGEHTP